MSLLLEILLLAVFAFAVGRFAPQPWRGRIFNLLKVWITVRILWLMAIHRVELPDGEAVPGWRLVLDQLGQIDPWVFVLFVLVGTTVRMSGVVASMIRWLLLLRGQGIELPFRHVFGSFLIGRAIGFFLPSTAGLDAYLLYDAARYSGRTVEVTAAKFLEKILGLSGIFLSFLVALPFGVRIFGANGPAVAAVTVPVCLGVIGALLVVLWYPGLVQWLLRSLPLPGKARLDGIVVRISNAASAYQDKRGLVVMVLFLSFLVHFTTAAMYYFMALAIGAGDRAEFWPTAFGSSIQILATVLSPFTIGGMGIREAAQYALLGTWIGQGAAIVSAHLGFWVGEFPTLFGFLFWVTRGERYRPAFCRVDGVQVDYDEAAKAAVALESDEDRARREAAGHAGALPSLPARVLHNAGLGLGTGIVAGIVIGLVETLVIAQGGFGGEAQVMWYGPLSYALVLGGLSLLGGAFLGLLPMSKEEAEGWTPALGMIGTLVPFGLAITLFRLRRDVFHEQMPPVEWLLGVLAAYGVLTGVLFFGGRRIFQSPAGWLVRPQVAVLLLAATVAGGFLGAGLAVGENTRISDPSAVPEALVDRPNVILVMVDTLRADHLSCYGAEDVATPHLCSLAEQGGTRFEGFSHASWTKPATASLLTSLLPSSHRAMSKVAVVPDDAVFVPEAFQEAGYATGGIASNINLAPSFGFDQGYDEYTYLGPDYLVGAEESSSKLILYQIVRKVLLSRQPGLRFGDFYQDSRVVNRRAFDFLERNADGRFFLFLHYMDPHDPYFVHPYDGTAVARVSTPEPDPEQARELRELYVGEIEYLDRNFGALLEKIDELGIAEDTLIALTADHGEEFHEHGGWWHGLTLYDEQIRVPLLVRWPAGFEAPALDGRIARHLDVGPTLLDAAGLDVPAGMQGRSLLAAVPGGSEPEVYSEEDHEGNVLWSLRTREAKLIVANPGNPRGLEEVEFYRVDADPGEDENLAGGPYAALERQMQENAEAHRRFAEGGAVEPGAEVQMSREECEQLRLLGYVEDCEHIQ